VTTPDYTPGQGTHTLNTVLRYAITNRALFAGDDRHQRAALLQQAARWIADGIDLIQLREKDLSAAAQAEISRKIIENIHLASRTTKLLLNSRADIAIVVAAHGVHLTGAPDELTPAQIRDLFAAASLPSPFISCSCHSLTEVVRAREGRADAILFAPVFGKTVGGEIVSSGQGLDRLHAACAAAAPSPVYALGGVTLDKAFACLEAGAVGIAGIRLFHDL
jgi:thiamine-phosphate pyrophosphorylase